MQRFADYEQDDFVSVTPSSDTEAQVSVKPGIRYMRTDPPPYFLILGLLILKKKT
jgi:hypothetical protein